MKTNFSSSVPIDVYRKLALASSVQGVTVSSYVSRILIEHFEGKEPAQTTDDGSFDMDKAIAAELGIDEDDEATAKDLL